MTLSYKYVAVKRPTGITVKSPMIPVTLIGNSAIKPEVIALLDSGADISIIPKDIAELLNLDLSGKEITAKGLGGEVKVKESKMQINIKKHHEDYTFIVPVQIILEDKKVPVLLGRVGFFEKFKITFDQNNFLVSLKHNSAVNRVY